MAQHLSGSENIISLLCMRISWFAQPHFVSVYSGQLFEIATMIRIAQWPYVCLTESQKTHHVWATMAPVTLYYPHPSLPSWYCLQDSSGAEQVAGLCH